MAFKKKGAPSAKSLSLYANDPGSADICHSSGVAPINGSGQIQDKSGKVMNWPYQRHTVDNELNPRSNEGRPSQLSENPQAYGDYSVDGKQNFGNVPRSTLG